MTLRAFTGQLANNTESRFSVYGRNIYMRSASAQLLITATSLRDKAGGNVLADRIPLTSRQGFDTDGNFDNLTVRNESGGAVDFEVIAGFGKYQAPLSSVSLEVPSIITAGANVTANAAGVQLLPANADRKLAWVCVSPTATNECILAESAVQAAAGVGLALSPGIAYPVESTAALFVARLGAADQTVHVLETEFA